MAQDRQVLIDAARAQADAAQKMLDDLHEGERTPELKMRVYELRMRALEFEVKVDTRDVITHIENRLAEIKTIMDR